MKHHHTSSARGMFVPITQSRALQAAVMVLRPGHSSSDIVENEHPRSEQWLFVISGAGTARVGARNIKLRVGSLLLIEKGERHRIKATGITPMRTINFYAPPAYDDEGEVRPAIAR